jgi:iron complex outermembrane receptor protein
MDKVYVNDMNGDAAELYNCIGLYRIYICYTDWSLNGFTRIDNLFNKQYIGSVIVNEGNNRFFEPADGRNWSAGIKLSKQF